MGSRSEPFEYPRRLLHRDSLNSFDVRVALSIIAELKSGYVTNSVLDELNKQGFDVCTNPILKSMKVLSEKKVIESVVIGAFYFPLQGKIFNDNIVVPCKECEALLQLRPKYKLSDQKFSCVFCAVDAALIEYWEAKDKKQKKIVKSKMRKH